MNLVIFFGPPGCGKGTQSDVLKAELNYKKTSTGDALRVIAKQDNDLGNEVASLMRQGKLIPDATVSEVITSSLEDVSGFAGVILDGYPRTLSQVEFLDDYLTNKKSGLFSKIKVIEIDVPDSLLINRICGRYVCASCGVTYHESLRPTREAGKCDNCGGVEFSKRSDDNKETVKERLQSYHDNFANIKAFYESRNLVFAVDGAKSIEEVREDIIKIALG